MSDKATVELVAGIQEVIEYLERISMRTICEIRGLSDSLKKAPVEDIKAHMKEFADAEQASHMKRIKVLEAALAALPTPTDASGKKGWQTCKLHADQHPNRPNHDTCRRTECPDNCDRWKPTPASGLVEALGKAIAAKLCEYDGRPQDWFRYHDPKGVYLKVAQEVVDKALAQHREGKQWSSEVPTVPGWWWRKTEYKVEPIEVVYDLEIPAPHLWIYDGYEFRPPLEYAKLHGGQWCGPLQPPADKEG